MINYISYILLKEINASAYLKELKWDLRLFGEEFDSNLLKQIAHKIYVESEYEPCGLKGCKMSIFLQTLDESQSSGVASLCNKTTNLVSQFRFDNTSSLTLFELNLVLQQDESNSSLQLTTTSNNNNNNNNVNQSSTSFAITTLTRRLFSNNNNNNNTNNSRPKSKQNEVLNNKPFYIDTNNYDLTKRNLYE
jgi:hypothetical protein